MMISITLQCSCGQDFAFEVEPVEGRMPSTVACPTCGLDATDRSNEEIQRQLAPPPTAAPSAKSETMMIVGASVAALALLGLAGGAVLWWKSRDDKTPPPQVTATAPPEAAASAPPTPEPLPATASEPSAPAPPPAEPVAQPAPVATVDPANVERDPSFVGIGALFDPDSKGEYVKIVKVMDKSPAKSAGIVPGDLLVRIDDTLIRDRSGKEIADLFFGPVGSKVTMQVISSKTGQTNRVEMVRKKYR